MKAFLASIDRFWYAPAPAERLALVRTLVGAFAVVYLAVRAPSFLAAARLPASHFAPVGLAAFLDQPLSPGASGVLLAMTLPAGLAFALGFRFRVSGPLFAALVLWLTSYRSSWGMVFHTENLLALHLVVLAASPAGDALAVPRSDSAAALEPHGRYGWALRAMSVITVVAYFLAGLAKLKIAGPSWASGDILRIHVAYDNLRKIELGSLHSPLGVALLHASWLFPPLAFGTLLLELGGFAAFFHRRLALVWCAGVWLFHVGVVLLMAIAFPYPLAVVPFLTFFEPEKTRLGRLVERIYLPRQLAAQRATARA